MISCVVVLSHGATLSSLISFGFRPLFDRKVRQKRGLEHVVGVDIHQKGGKNEDCSHEAADIANEDLQSVNFALVLELLLREGDLKEGESLSHILASRDLRGKDRRVLLVYREENHRLGLACKEATKVFIGGKLIGRKRYSSPLGSLCGDLESSDR